MKRITDIAYMLLSQEEFADFLDNLEGENKDFFKIKATADEFYYEARKNLLKAANEGGCNPMILNYYKNCYEFTIEAEKLIHIDYDKTKTERLITRYE